MTAVVGEDRLLWRNACGWLEEDWRRLPAHERVWIEEHLHRIGIVQQRLHELFDNADGAALCTACAGACCACGKHHVTLVNLLAVLAGGRTLPHADFTAPCPMLGPQGCRLDVVQRPFNCVTFVCGPLEDAMGTVGAAAFYSAEKELRRLYAAFEERYVGAGMRGYLLAAARLAGRSPLAPVAAGAAAGGA